MSTGERLFEELRALIEADYEITYLITFEEDRATEMVRQVAKSLDFQLFTYSSAGGLDQPRSPGAVPDQWQEMNPMSALGFIRECTVNGLFLLYDFHQYLSTPEISRALRDLTLDRGNGRRHVIITAPHLSLPPELSKTVNIVELELPSPGEIHQYLQTVTERLLEAPGFIPPESGEMEELVSACQGLTRHEYERAKSWARLRRLDIATIRAEKHQLIRKSDVLEYWDTSVSFSDIGGLDAFKAWIEERKSSFTESARRFGLPFPKGALLLGIPGTGKSYASKAAAHEMKLPLIHLDMGKVFGGYIGSSEANIRKAIQVVEAVAPAVLWIDELEKGLSGSASSNLADAGTSARVFGTFLQWMSERTKPVFIVATANDIREIGTHHPELLRKGRFDEIFFVDLPSKADRREIFRIHLEKPRELHPGGRDATAIDLTAVAEATSGYTGSEIEHVVISGLFKAFRHGREPVTDDFLTAVRDTHPLSDAMKEQVDFIRSWAQGRARWAN